MSITVRFLTPAVQATATAFPPLVECTHSLVLWGKLLPDMLGVDLRIPALLLHDATALGLLVLATGFLLVELRHLWHAGHQRTAAPIGLALQIFLTACNLVHVALLWAFQIDAVEDWLTDTIPEGILHVAELSLLAIVSTAAVRRLASGAPALWRMIRGGPPAGPTAPAAE